MKLDNDIKDTASKLSQTFEDIVNKDPRYEPLLCFLPIVESLKQLAKQYEVNSHGRFFELYNELYVGRVVSDLPELSLLQEIIPPPHQAEFKALVVKLHESLLPQRPAVPQNQSS